MVIYDVAAFGVAMAVGAFTGLLGIAVIYHPSRVRGATQRIGQAIQVLIVGLMGVLMWALAAGLYHPSYDQPDTPTGSSWGLALGYTVGAGTLALPRWRRSRSLPDAAAAPGRHSERSGMRRGLRIAIRVADYLFGALLVMMAYLYGGLLHQWALTRVSTWLGEVVLGGAVVAHILVAVVGFGYSQVVFRAAQSGLDRALGRDWGVSRTAHFLLLGLPFLLALEGVLVMPGLLTGILTQMVVLAVGWRFTDEHPQGTVATLRCVVKSVRQARADRASDTRLGSTRPEQSDAPGPSSDEVRSAVSTSLPGPRRVPLRHRSTNDHFRNPSGRPPTAGAHDGVPGLRSSRRAGVTSDHDLVHAVLRARFSGALAICAPVCVVRSGFADHQRPGAADAGRRYPASDGDLLTPRP